MTNKITTAPGLIGTLSWLQSKKLQYIWLIAQYKEELEKSELVLQIRKWEQMLADLIEEENDLKIQWITILDTAWIDKFEANWVEVRKKVTAWSLIIDDESLIDKEYIKTEVVPEKTVEKIDKNAIKKDMKEWLIIDGVHLEQKVTLEIKYK